jgi:Flp pilus assembly CpaF family ATPase
VPLPDVVSMQTRQPNLEGAGEIPLRRLVKEALRMRPSRIVVGQVCQEECLDLLIALNSGLPGVKQERYTGSLYGLKDSSHVPGVEPRHAADVA